jgi:hypothetical protein
MYFSFIPSINYNVSNLSYPFSDNDYIVAKNFFKRYKVNENLASSTRFFKKYAVNDGDRLDTIAERAYGNPFYDWIIVLTNNIVNPSFAFPLTSQELRKQCEKLYSNPYSEIVHYKTYEVKNNLGIVVLEKDLIVDKVFYEGTFQYWNGSQVQSVLGSQISYPVTAFEYEEEENEKKREIYILKPRYVDSFVEDFRKNNFYTQSSSYITSSLKQTNK